MDDLWDRAGHFASGIGEQLTALDSPLAAASVITAALVFLAKLVLKPLWTASAMNERSKLNRLSAALTYPRFLEVMGQEPNCYRDLTPHKEHDAENAKPLQSRLFVLSRTYVEAFIDEDDRVYGFTITLRRPTYMRAVNCLGWPVRLGWTSLKDAWPPEWGPHLLAWPRVRNYSLFEVTRGSGASLGKTCAVGFQDSARHTATPLVHYSRPILDEVRFWKAWLQRSLRYQSAESNNFQKDLVRAADRLKAVDCAIVQLPQDWARDPAAQQLRAQVRVNSISVAFSDEIRYSMLSLHSWDTHVADPLVARFHHRQKKRQTRWDHLLSSRRRQHISRPDSVA